MIIRVTLHWPARWRRISGDRERGSAKRLVPGGQWDPFAFVDAVESAMHNGQHVDALQNVQRLEFESLAASILA